MAVGKVFCLRVIVVALEVPAGDVVGVAVAVVVETATGGTLQDLPLCDLAVAEDGDQVFGGEVWGALAVDIDRVEVLVLAARDAGPAGGFDVDVEPASLARGGVGLDAGRAGRVDARVMDVIAEVQAAVAVEVVAVGPGEARPVGALGTRQLALVEPLVVEGVFDAVRAVVGATLDIGDDNVVAADVPIGPGAGEVDPRHVVGVERRSRPAGQPTVRVRKSAGAGVLGIAERAVHIELVVVVAARAVAVEGHPRIAVGGGVLAWRKIPVVGRPLRREGFRPLRLGRQRRGDSQRQEDGHRDDYPNPLRHTQPSADPRGLLPEVPPPARYNAAMGQVLRRPVRVVLVGRGGGAVEVGRA